MSSISAQKSTNRRIPALLGPTFPIVEFQNMSSQEMEIQKPVFRQELLYLLDQEFTISWHFGTLRSGNPSNQEIELQKVKDVP